VLCGADRTAGTRGLPQLEANRAASRLIRALPAMAAGRHDVAAHRHFRRAK
jgi:hypothetical protein